MANVTGTAGADIIRPGQVSLGVAGVTGPTDPLAANDSINGGNGNDTLGGGAGTDTLAGGAGDDTAIVDAADVLAADRFNGGAGVDTLDSRSLGVADISGLVLAGVERLVLRNGETAIGPGQTTGVTFFDAPGNFFTLRGASAGTYDFTAATYGQFYQGFTGSAGDDSVVGGASGEVLNGAAGADTIAGGAGNDTMSGGTGADSLLGGTGDDRATWAIGDITVGESFDGGDGTDLADFRSGGLGDITGVAFTGVETIQVRNGNTAIGAGQFTGVTTTIDAPGQFFTLSGSGSGVYNLSGVTFGQFFQGFTGSSGNDSITGNAVGNVLSGGDGVDTVNGAAGNDTLTGGLGLDTLQGGTGNDTAIFALTDIAIGEQFNGGADSDTADFRTNGIGDITGVRLISVESVLVRNGNTLIGSGQFTGLATTIDAPNSFFTLAASAAGAYSFATVTFGQFFLGFTGSSGNDSVLGNAAGNVLSGADGADSVDGAAGNDTLRGGLGADTLLGGEGDDTAVYALGDPAPGELFDGGLGLDTADFRTNGVATIADFALADVETVLLRNGETLVAPGQFTGAVTTLTAPNSFFRLGGTVAGTYDFATVTFAQFFEGFTGTTGNDSIRGSLGAEVLNGGDGADTVAGNDGNDTLNGQVGGDSLAGGAGDDRAVWAVGEIGPGEAFDGGDGADLADFRTGGLADISGIAFSNVETIQVRNGATTIGAGQFTGVTTTIDAPNSFFTLAAAGAGAFDLSGLTFGTFFQGFNGSAGDDSVLGNGAGTVLNGAEGADVLDGAAGNDTLSGGLGRDVLLGGLGDDRAVWAVGDIAAGERFDGGDGADLADFRSGGLADISGVAFENVESIQVRGGATAVGTGQFSGVTTAIDAPNSFFTLAAATGGTFDFTDVTFGTFFQGFTGSIRTDVVFGNGAANVLGGDAGNDSLMGGAGNDTLNGGAGSDVAFYVGASTDFAVTTDVNGRPVTVQDLRPGAPEGLDTLVNMEGVRFINGVYQRGGAADDSIGGTARSDLLLGLGGADTLDGGGANDYLFGGLGGDSLSGGGAVDVLLGGGGLDTMSGGLAKDSFLLDNSALGAAAVAQVTITDFSRADLERIDLTAIDANATLAGDQAFTWTGPQAFNGTAGRLRAQQVGADVLVQGDVDGDLVADLTMLLVGVTGPATGSWFFL